MNLIYREDKCLEDTMLRLRYFPIQAEELLTDSALTMLRCAGTVEATDPPTLICRYPGSARILLLGLVTHWIHR